MLEKQASRQKFKCLPLLLIPVIAAGCWMMGSEDSPPAQTSNGIEGEKDVHSTNGSQSKEIVAGWKAPQFALVLTGEQKGYMEPCGCSETQSGGISRRADLFRQLREDKGWEVAGLDLGDFVKRSRRQDQIKFGVMHTALEDMGYEALTLGPADLKLQVDYLFSTMSNAGDLPYVSANVIFYDTPDIGSPARFRVIELNGVKIGVTGVLGSKFASKIFPEGDNSANDLLRIDDPVASLKPIVATLKEQGCDILFLLSQASKSETESILKSIPDFDLCLSGGGPEDPNGLTETVGKTVVMEAGRKGKYAGVLGYFPDEEKKFRFELVDLNKDRFQRTQAMEEHMAFYQDLLREQNIVESEPAVPHPSGYTFVGSEKCGTCHTKAYAKWKSTKHSHATETLIKGEENYSETEWISRINDPECLACHAVGWNPQEVFRFEGGFVNMEDTPHLTGQGCENCHGPGSHHTEMEAIFTETRQSTPEIIAAREGIKVNLVTAEKQVCNKCHDFENSPKFNFVKYWDKVIHRGKD